MGRLHLEPSLTLSARDAYELELFLQLEEVRLRTRGDARRQAFHQLLMDIHVLAVSYAEAVTAPTAGSRQLPRRLPEVGASSKWLSVSDVADVVDCSGRGVRDAAIAGRLPGTKDKSGRWWFDTDDVVAWKVAREGRSAA